MSSSHLNRPRTSDQPPFAVINYGKTKSRMGSLMATESKLEAIKAQQISQVHSSYGGNTNGFTTKHSSLAVSAYINQRPQ